MKGDIRFRSVTDMAGFAANQMIGFSVRPENVMKVF